VTTDSKKEGWGAGVKTALIALPVLYVLSIGPVVYWVDGRGVQLPPQAQTALRIFYAPLLVSMGLSGLESPFVTYLQWWADLAKRP
jgi:hypothetical protein